MSRDERANARQRLPRPEPSATTSQLMPSRERKERLKCKNITIGVRCLVPDSALYFDKCN